MDIYTFISNIYILHNETKFSISSFLKCIHLILQPASNSGKKFGIQRYQAQRRDKKLLSLRFRL